MKIELRNIGLDLVVVASAITICGVISLNILLAPRLAMQFWAFSNPIFALYFYGRWKHWWDGGICDEIMCCIYLGMFISGVWGLMQ